MTQDFPKIEDIVYQLTADLTNLGFLKIDPKENEVVRYQRRNSHLNFQVGIEQEYNDPEEPQFNHIHLVVGYDLPAGTSQRTGENVFPRPELMYDFFRNTSIYHHSLTFNEDRFKDGRMNLVYHIGFEKDKTTALKMRTILREIGYYFCNSVTTNVQMLTSTQSFDR